MQWLRCLPAGQISGLKFVFLHTKATSFETMMTTVDEVNSNKTNALGELIFCGVLLECFTAELHQ